VWSRPVSHQVRPASGARATANCLGYNLKIALWSKGTLAGMTMRLRVDRSAATRSIVHSRKGDASIPFAAVDVNTAYCPAGAGMRCNCRLWRRYAALHGGLAICRLPASHPCGRAAVRGRYTCAQIRPRLRIEAPGGGRHLEQMGVLPYPLPAFFLGELRASPDDSSALANPNYAQRF